MEQEELETRGSKEENKTEGAVDKSVDKPVKAAEKQGTPFKPGQSGNPAGKRKGTKNFNTLFEQAIKSVAEMADVQKALDGNDPEVVIVKRAILEAIKGKYQFTKDILDRRYGQARQTIDANLIEIPPINIVSEAAAETRDEEK